MLRIKVIKSMTYEPIKVNQSIRFDQSLRSIEAVAHYDFGRATLTEFGMMSESKVEICQSLVDLQCVGFGA